MVPIKKDELSDKIVLCKWQSNPQEIRWRMQTTEKTSRSTRILCMVCFSSVLFLLRGESKWKGSFQSTVCTDLACQLSSCRHLY
ncbi:hypothetical protein GHT06_016777 [Daphnia sinensis]|uniref:Uncharacterized protein n=1 Tax=Daphnia sinensis TaxID=1820382 RepID=A0AAD5PRQ3_9CRUS|nr:hypothetical protein GHT06_016777 [Daphnia sinensis]